jgi:hypothetical protein
VQLSVCCLTGDRPAAVAAIMRLLRPVADEIVVAVDSTVDPSALGPLLDVADTVVRFEYVDPPERARPWLTGLCRGANMLMIDGDEVPSAALLDTLPALCADASVQQVRIARRWCYPDEWTWLAERPWWPDFQRRLVRPPLDFDLDFHGGMRQTGPDRCVEEAIYHLVDIVRPYSLRRRRASEYERARPGMVAVGGGPMNAILYEPERFATRRPVEAPAHDVVALRSVLNAPDPRPVSTAVPLVAAAEVAAAVPPDPLDRQGYRAEVRVVEADLRTEPGLDTHVVVEVHNTGASTLPCRDEPGIEIRVAARLVDHRSPEAEWWYTPLPCDIPPGATRALDAVLQSTASPGTRMLEVALRNLRGRWFEARARAAMDVTSRWGRFDS